MFNEAQMMQSFTKAAKRHGITWELEINDDHQYIAKVAAQRASASSERMVFDQMWRMLKSEVMAQVGKHYEWNTLIVDEHPANWKKTTAQSF